MPETRDSYCQLFKNLKILPLQSQYTFPFHYLLPEIEIYMNQIQKLIISTPDTVLTYILQTANLTNFQKGPFYFEIKNL
jgi:hypothetical protein